MENYKQRNCYQICLLLFNNNVDLKNIFLKLYKNLFQFDLDIPCNYL